MRFSLRGAHPPLRGGAQAASGGCTSSQDADAKHRLWSEASRGGVSPIQPPHPDRLRFATAVDPPPAGEGGRWHRATSPDLPACLPPPKASTASAPTRR